MVDGRREIGKGRVLPSPVYVYRLHRLRGSPAAAGFGSGPDQEGAVGRLAVGHVDAGFAGGAGDVQLDATHGLATLRPDLEIVSRLEGSNRLAKRRTGVDAPA